MLRRRSRPASAEVRAGGLDASDPVDTGESAKMPRAASQRLSQRILMMLVFMTLLFIFSDLVLYNRAFRNPLFVFCVTLSLVAFLAAAIFPRDSMVSRPVVTAGMVTWSIISARITVYEWDERQFEPSLRTHIRRCVLITWSLINFGVTFSYIAEVVRSSWIAIRALFLIGALTDIFHTALIHALYYLDPDSQPTVPIHHTSGLRVGPPPFAAYAPCIYLVIITYFLNAHARERISRVTGGARLSVGLGEVRAGELPGLFGDPLPPLGVGGGGLLAVGCVPAHHPTHCSGTSVSEDPDKDEAQAGQPLSESELLTVDHSTAADLGGSGWISADLAGMRARLQVIAEERRRLDLEQYSLERRVALAEAATREVRPYLPHLPGLPCLT